MAKTPRVLGHASDKLRSDKDYMPRGNFLGELGKSSVFLFASDFCWGPKYVNKKKHGVQLHSYPPEAASRHLHQGAKMMNWVKNTS